MTLTLSPPQVLNPIFGTQISFADWNQLLLFTLQTTGYATAFQQGVENAMPLLQPMQLAADGSTMTLEFGGDVTTPQFVLTNGLLCGVQTKQPFVVPNNSSGITRTDKLWVLPNLTQVSTVNREVEDVDGNKTPNVPIPVVVSGLLAVYDTGGLTPPGGNYQQFASISVVNGATHISPGDVTLLFPNMNPAGPTGAAGHGSTLSTSTCTIPAVNSTTTVPVVDATAFPVGALGLISDGTHAFVFVVAGVASLTLTLQCLQIILGSAADTVGSGATVTFSGKPGTAGSAGTPGTPGANGADGHGATSTTSTESTPAVGAAGALAVVDGTAFPNGALGIVSDGTHAYAFVVASGGGTAALVTTCLGIILGAAADTISSGATVTFSGITPSTVARPGQVFIKQAYTDGSSSGTLTMNSALPGGASQTYALRALMQIKVVTNSTTATATLTGNGGATWSSSPRAVSSSSNGAATSVAVSVMIGTATGGQTPSITWAIGTNGTDVGYVEIQAVAL